MDMTTYALLNSKLKSVTSGIKNITFENGELIFTTNDDRIVNVTVPNMHLHGNKDVLDKFTVIQGKLYYEGRNLEVECHEHVNKFVLDSITSSKVAEWNNKVDKVSGKSLVDDVEIDRLASITNYDDAEIKLFLKDITNKLNNHIDNHPSSDGISSKPLSGIRWFNYGDSLSEFKAEDSNGVQYGWTDRVQELTGATIKNCALAGSHIQDLVGVMANKGFTNDDIATADIITIQNYGNNEFESSTYPLGSVNDTADINSNSTCAGLKGVIAYIQNLNSTAPIIFITEPLLYAKTYRPTLIQVCQNECIDVLDLAVKCGFNVRNKSSWYLDDDTHLLGEGYKRWGELVSDYVVATYGYVLKTMQSEIDTTKPIIVLSTSNLTVNENATNTFTVKLDKQPESNVVVTLSASNSNITLSPQSLIFTSSNYNINQSVTVTGNHNSESYVNLFSVITASSTDLTSKTINVTITNIDTNPNPSSSYTTRGLQLDYDFKGGSGTSVADKSSNAKALALSNCTWNPTGLVCNGSSSIGTATGTDSGNFVPTTELSFEAYFKPTAIGTVGDLIGRATMYQYVLSFGEDGKTHLYIYDGSATQDCASTSTTTLSQYVHYIGTYNNASGDMKLYKNGVLENTVNLPSKPSLPALAMDGGSYDYTVGGQNIAGHYYNGEIGFVRYYNVELTQAEVTANYNSIQS